MSAIWTEDLTRIYGRDESRVEALAGVSLEVEPGEWVAIVDPSGSGRRTLMNLLGLLDRPTSGTCQRLGFSTSRPPKRSIVPAFILVATAWCLLLSERKNWQESVEPLPTQRHSPAAGQGRKRSSGGETFGAAAVRVRARAKEALPRRRASGCARSPPCRGSRGRTGRWVPDPARSRGMTPRSPAPVLGVAGAGRPKTAEQDRQASQHLQR